MRLFSRLAAIVIPILLLGGCVAAVDSISNPGSLIAPEQSDGQTESGSGGLENRVPNGLATVTDTVSVGVRSVIQTAALNLSADEPLETFEKVQLIVAEVDGRVDSRSQQSNNAGEVWQVYLTIRVPATDLQRALDEISELGQVDYLEVSATDVTVTVIDLRARVKALEASVERLLALISSADTTSDLIDAEYALSSRQAELESVTAQLRYYEDQVALSTISLTISAEGTGPVKEPATFWEGVVAGWEALVDFTLASVVTLGVVIPWLLPVAALALIAVIALRLLRRKR